MGSRSKAVVSFLRTVAVGVSVQAAYVALDQTVRSLINEHLKKKFAKKEEEKKARVG